MKLNVTRAVLAVILFHSIAASAAERTVTLAVDKMTCVTCPYIVKQALSRVPGVTRAEVSFEDKRALVTFDDTRAKVATLTKATADAGFPSQSLEK